MAAALPSHNENDCMFYPALVYDADLGADVPVTTKQAAVEAVTKLPPYLENTLPGQCQLTRMSCLLTTYCQNLASPAIFA